MAAVLTMGQILAFRPEKLVLPVLISQHELRPLLIEELSRSFGSIDYTSADLPFNYTRYYDEEMGSPITRFFLSFTALIDPGDLARIKLRTNEIEARFASEGRRRINLDPGLLNLSRLILASSKDGSHRIPLAQGVYAEVTLVYERGKYRPLPWTYPDYRSPQYLEILKAIRGIYRQQRKSAEC